jgi:hypothetical protein
MFTLLRERHADYSVLLRLPPRLLLLPPPPLPGMMIFTKWLFSIRRRKTSQDGILTSVSHSTHWTRIRADNQVLIKGQMLDYYDISGCYILRPGSFNIWQNIQGGSPAYRQRSIR